MSTSHGKTACCWEGLMSTSHGKPSILMRTQLEHCIRAEQRPVSPHQLHLPIMIHLKRYLFTGTSKFLQIYSIFRMNTPVRILPIYHLN